VVLCARKKPEDRLSIFHIKRDTTPAYAQNLLPRSVISRPLLGDVPTIDLVVGYSKTNTSQILKLFLSRIDDLIARVAKKTH